MTKRRAIAARKDLISEMPRNIIDMILEALPTTDAVRTSALSRKWQHYWATTSKLVFDYPFFESMSAKSLSGLEVRNIINKILLLHTGPIPTFILQIDLDYLSLAEDINEWLRFLSRNSIKELTLHFPTNHFYRIGLQLYSCLQLTHLSIQYCKLELDPPASFKGFPNLTTLHLTKVFVTEKIGDVIAACPRLERLSLLHCIGFRSLAVRASNIKYLHVECIKGLKNIGMDVIENVEHISISLCDKAVSVQQTNMERLRFGNHFLKFSVASRVPKRLPASLDSLKKLVLSYLDFNDVAQIACAFCLIRSSPKLSELELWGHCTEYDTTQDLNLAEAYGIDGCNFGQLQTVKLLILRGFEAEIAVIKFLLAHSPLLERMFIMMDNDTDKDQSLDLCKRLLRFDKYKASPKVDIIYVDP